MTDNEIIKALECCLILHKCDECPCDFDTNGKTFCKDLGLKIFDLIKRRQIYIERLQEYYRRYNDLEEETEELRIEVEYAREKISQMEEFIITTKSEAVREFAEELMYNLDGDIEAYANAGHGLNVYEWLKSYLVSKGAIEMGCNDG